MKPIWGKLVGGAAGLVTGKPWFALLGVLLGHQFDRGFAERLAGAGSVGERQLRYLPDYFIEALFQTLGHVAKADGRVTEDEIRATRSLMHRLQMKPAQVRQAIDWFEAGKLGSFPVDETLRRLREQTARRPELREIFVRLLLEVSLSKPTLGRRERAALWRICTGLDVGRVQFAQLEALLRARRGFRARSEGGGEESRDVRQAYSVLGVSRTSSNDEIKTAYRRLMNKNHPDKIAASNPDPAAIDAAQKRTRDIRSAYEMLKAYRSIR